MATKKYKYINSDLEWCEKTLKDWRADVDNHPFEKIEDRWGQKLTTSGGVTHVIAATIEQQKESYRKTLKDVLELLPRINELREAEDIKQQATAKGGITIPDIMKG